MRDPWSAIVAELFRQIQTFSRGNADRAPTYKGDPTGFEEPTGGHRDECRSGEPPNAATSMEVKMTGSRVIPCLRYRDAKRMIGWLCDAFGFRAQAVYEDGSDVIAHAQLTLGDGMIMLGSLRDDRLSQVQSTPAALGGTTQSPYLVVADADAIYHSAVAAGAEIVI